MLTSEDFYVFFLRILITEPSGDDLYRYLAHYLFFFLSTIKFNVLFIYIITIKQPNFVLVLSNQLEISAHL